jgi:hypothetical protein
MFEEAKRAGLVMDPGTEKEGRMGEYRQADEYNHSLYFVGTTRIYEDLNEGIVAEDPYDLADAMYKTWNDTGIEVDEVKLIQVEDDAEIPYDNTVDRSNVYRVWISAGKSLRKEIEAIRSL